MSKLRALIERAIEEKSKRCIMAARQMRANPEGETFSGAQEFETDIRVPDRLCRGKSGLFLSHEF